MLQDPISIYEDARRRNQQRMAEGARRQALRREQLDQGLRHAVAAMLRRTADAVDGQAPAWQPGRALEDV